MRGVHFERDLHWLWVGIPIFLIGAAGSFSLAIIAYVAWFTWLR